MLTQRNSTGVISSILISLGNSLSRPTTTWDKSLIASSTSFLALVVSPISGHLADALGRRPVIAIASFLFVLGALVQAAATQVWIMVLGRSIIGAAIGAASGVVPLFIAEVAPAEQRGRLVTVQSLFITGGQVIAYLVGWAVQGQWRITVAVGAVPALVQGVLLCFMPESPRWLVMKGQDVEARLVLVRLGQDEAVLESIRDEVAKEKGLSKDEDGWKTSLRSLLRVPGHRRALTIACMLQAIQQLCGFVSLDDQSHIVSSCLTLASELTDVLFRHNLCHGRLYIAHNDVSQHSNHKLHLHPLRLPSY